ncbi:MAG TPA: DUF4956 domain-containing protein [Gemmatimonadales bacterium]|nr:DUF4956 domain-containing protein [Gemmatimonadales bacterium]
MAFFTRMMDLATGGSESPVRRLLVYYAFLVLVTTVLVRVFPPANVLFAGERLEEAIVIPQLLNDGLASGTPLAMLGETDLSPRLQSVLTTFVVMIGALFLMLPVSWVYMAVRRSTGYAQSIVQTMLVLPIVVAGVVLVVRNSLALAFSLAAIMAGVRFRNNLRDPRDTVFIFLSIGVGLAAGVQALTIAAVLSLVFNVLILTIWRTNFGRSPLNLAPRAGWAEPLETLIDTADARAIPDRDLVLSLTPEKADALAERFARVRDMLGGGDGKSKKPRYNGVLKVTVSDEAAGRAAVEPVLKELTKRYHLDGVETAEGRPLALYYLVRVRKKAADDVVSAILGCGGDAIQGAEFEIATKDDATRP